MIIAFINKSQYSPI